MARKITEISPLRTFLGGFLISVHSICANSPATIIAENQRGEQRMKQKYYVELNRQEWRLIIEGLNRFRNKLIAAGRYTDAVDEILIKVAKATPQKSMLWGWRR